MNTDPLNSRAVTYLYEVAVQGGVRAAAEALAVNPSVVSRQIALLERTLRMPLLTRQGRTVVVTEVGQMLVDFHRDRQRGTRQLHAQLAEYRGLERGRITVAVGEGFVEGFVTGALQRFSLKHPHISIDIRSGSTSAVVAMVRNDEVDIGLCVGAGREPGCKTRTFSLGPLCAVMTPDHALAGTSKVQPSALAGHRLIFMASHFAVQEHLQAMLDAEALTLAPAYRCDLFSTAPDAGGGRARHRVHVRRRRAPPDRGKAVGCRTTRSSDRAQFPQPANDEKRPAPAARSRSPLEATGRGDDAGVSRGVARGNAGCDCRSNDRMRRAKCRPARATCRLPVGKAPPESPGKCG